MKSSYKGVLLIISSAFGFSLMPIFAKYAYDYGAGVFSLLFIRFTTASALFFIYMAIKKVKLKVTLKGILYFMLLGGVCYTLQSSFFFFSVKYTSPAMAEILMYTYPLFVALLSLVFYRERLGWKAIASMLFSFAGLIVITNASLGHVNAFGMLLALLAGVVYSIYIIIGNHVVKTQEPLISSAFITLFTAVGFLAAGLPTGNINFDFDMRALLPIGGIALFSTVVAVFTFLKGLEHVSPTKASILSMLEPIFTIVITAVLFGNTLTLLQIAGGTAALAGAAIVAVSKGTLPEKDGGGASAAPDNGAGPAQIDS